MSIESKQGDSAGVLAKERELTGQGYRKISYENRSQLRPREYCMTDNTQDPGSFEGPAGKLIVWCKP